MLSSFLRLDSFTEIAVGGFLRDLFVSDAAPSSLFMVECRFLDTSFTMSRNRGFPPLMLVAILVLHPGFFMLSFFSEDSFPF